MKDGGGNGCSELERSRVRHRLWGGLGVAIGLRLWVGVSLVGGGWACVLVSVGLGGWVRGNWRVAHHKWQLYVLSTTCGKNKEGYLATARAHAKTNTHAPTQQASRHH